RVRARARPARRDLRRLGGARPALPRRPAPARGAARRRGLRARARARQLARAPREPLRGAGARCRVDAGGPPAAGAPGRAGRGGRGAAGLVAELAGARARRSSRRSFLARLGALLVGAGALPLLPVARTAGAAREGAPGEPDAATPEGDPRSCAYWRHCAIDG